MPESFLAACALVLVLEGLLPFLAPRTWREAFRRLTELSDGQLRFVGLVSIAIGEFELLPAIRKAPPDWLVIANGFSCREQICQGTDRHALHLSEVLQMALRDGPAGPEGSYPERRLVREKEAQIRQSMRHTSLAVAGAAAGAALLWQLSRKH